MGLLEHKDDDDKKKGKANTTIIDVPVVGGDWKMDNDVGVHWTTSVVVPPIYTAITTTTASATPVVPYAPKSDGTYHNDMRKFDMSDVDATERVLTEQRWVETRGGKNTATSSAGAKGIAQIMPDTWAELKDMKYIPQHYDINNDEHNIAGQKAYMFKRLQAFDAVSSAPQDTVEHLRRLLASYNGGPGNVAKALKKAEYSQMDWLELMPLETRNYVATIFERAGINDIQ